MTLADFSTYVTIVVGVSGVFGIFFGVFQYRESRIQQRKTTILALVKEFEDKSKKDLGYAIECLDDFYVNPQEGWDNQSDRYYGNENLETILRDHNERAVTDPGEIAIRESFDYLMGFFGKIGYLRDIGLIEDEELEFFKYYLKKAANSKAVIAYTSTYKVPLYTNLVTYMQKKGLLS